MNYTSNSSELLEKAVNEFAKLPGIGKKTALRLLLFLLKQEEKEVQSFGNSIIRLKKEIKYCKICNNIADNEICNICINPSRDKSLVCVVETIQNVIAIENTQQYRGLYHILGGIISPIDGIGPNDLYIDSLINKVAQNDVKEVILALSSTLEGDTTNFYLYKKLNKYHVDISTIARGVSIGDELEYTDEITLGCSILNRTTFEVSNPS